MTSPTSVGQVSVELVAEARALAKSLRSEVEKAFKGLDLDKAIRDSIGDKPFKVRVEADVDTSALAETVRQARVPKVDVPLDPDTDSIPEKVKRTRVPKVSVPLDPLLAAFQQEVRRQTAALSRRAIKIPVDGDTAGLRAELGTQLAAIQAQSRIEVPTDPGSKAAYETKLKALLAEVSARVKQHVQVDVDKSSTAGLSRGLRSLPVNPLRLLQSAFGSLSEAMQESGNAAVRAGGSIAGALTTAAGPVGAVAAGFAILVGGIGAVAAAATVAVPAITSLVGAIAALPGLLAGAGAGIGTLALGFRGIAEAFKPKTGGGGGGSAEDAASRARRIAAAERGVESARRGITAATRGLESAERGYVDAVRRVGEAQKRAQQAQLAVNRARREALEDISDLNRELAGAKLSEEDATLRVTEALRALNEAKETGVLPDIQRADLEYRQAQQALLDAKDATEDLGEAAADANKKGVEGSDKVQDALEDQQQAIQAVKDAQNGVVDAQDAIAAANDSLKASYDGLASAQDSLAEAQKRAASAGGGGALKDVIKLAPEAQKFVDAIKALKPAFEDLRLDVQNKLFKDLDTTVTNVGDAWIPALRTTLGDYATTFNQFFRDLGRSITTPKFITDIQAGAESGRKALAAIGTSITDSLVPAFGSLSKAAGPFIEALGDEIAGVVEDFGRWVTDAENSDALTDFFATATEALHDMFTTGRQVTRMIGNIFTILTNGNGKNDKSAIDSFNDGLEAVNRWLEDPANQQAIADFVDQVKQGLKDLADAAKTVKSVLDRLLPNTDGSEGKASSLGAGIGKALVSGLIAGMWEAIKANFGANGVLVEMLLTGPFSLIGGIKTLLGIKSPSTVMAEIGGFLIDGLIGGIAAKAEELLQAAAAIPGKIRDGVGNLGKLLYGQGRSAVAGLVNGAVSLGATLSNRFTGLRTSISNVFSRAGSLLYSAGRNAVAGLINGVVSLASTLSTRVSGLRNTITAYFVNAGTLLYSSGRNVVIGLYNGIASLGSWLSRQVRNFVNAYVPAVIQNALGINSPSKVAAALGRRVPEGLALGIDAGARDVQAAADRLAQLAVPGVDAAGLSGDMEAAVSSNLAIAGAHTFVLDFAPGFTGDFLVDGLKKNIKARNNGNVLAALGS